VTTYGPFGLASIVISAMNNPPLLGPLYMRSRAGQLYRIDAPGA
jgi:hypothetical protein